MKIYLAQQKNSAESILIDENGICHAGCTIVFNHIHDAKKYNLEFAYDNSEEDVTKNLFAPHNGE